MEEGILSKAYLSQEVEERWYNWWVEKGYFRARLDSLRPVFVMVIPPPNVTGSLHMGHALNNTLQDILARLRRMQGYNVLWLPGTDHAGIATQNVVERLLASEGQSLVELGREKFVERVWAWKEKSGHTIINQLKRLGASCDWSRQRFTLDEGFSQAVREAFVRLYHQGLIYRGDYVINWCPRCRTALSDLETELEEVAGELYYVDYPLLDGSGALTVATTRPETMLGDVALAFHPQDSRYQDLLGKKARLPLLERELDIIADECVDPAFGTGLLKITPAHDFNDFEVGLRHNLPRPRVMSEEGRMNEAAGPYRGLDRYECRQAVLDDLRRTGLLIKVEKYTHTVGHCYRCKTVVEPYLSKQWFVKTRPLAEPAIEAVQKGLTRIIPKGWETTYFEWMNNIRDWCISRQIWWGHRIPAWHCSSCGEVAVGHETPGRCPACGRLELVQESDVLDTWFSSALWPFAALGWPEATPELELFYSTSCLVTGFDILFFWVARMMMMGIRLTGQVPFKEVYIHALVRDAEGQKMSKSRGNVIDPLAVSHRYGTDAFRFTLAALAVQGRDIKLAEERIAGYRHFANKLWNVARFVLMNLEDLPQDRVSLKGEKLELADRWILSRLNRVTGQVTQFLEEYRFSEAANSIYQFLWHEFCDWYVELAKLSLAQEGERRAIAQRVLCHGLETVLRLLHPFMPFITEEIWQKLPHQGESISIASYPEVEKDFLNEEAEGQMTLVIEIIKAIRNLKGELGIPASRYLCATIQVRDPSSWTILNNYKSYLIEQARLSSLELGREVTPPVSSVSTLAGEVEIYVPLLGVIDINQELRRLEKEYLRVEKEFAQVQGKLSQASFLARADPEVVERERERDRLLKEKQEKLAQWRGKIAALLDEQKPS